MGICSLLFEDKFGEKPDTAIHYLKFMDGLKDLNLSNSFMDDLKRLIIDIHNQTQSEDPEDYPCKCGGWCERDFKKSAET